MAGRPITNNSARAQQKREYMRRVRAKARPGPFNPQPLAQAINNHWRN